MYGKEIRYVCIGFYIYTIYIDNLLLFNGSKYSNFLLSNIPASLNGHQYMEFIYPNLKKQNITYD